MKTFIIFLTAALCSILLETATGEDDCIKLSYCASVEADLRDTKGTPAVKYRAATDANNQHKNYLKAKNPSVLKACQDKLKACTTATTNLAIQKFKFPKKYTSCNYETFSKAIFDCKNLEKWPSTVTGSLATRILQCRTDCIVDEPKPVVLSNKKRLHDYKSKIDESVFEARKTSGVGIEGRSIKSSRRIDHFQSTNLHKDSDWGVADTCMENTWAHAVWVCYLDTFDKIMPHMPNRVYFGCTHDVKEKTFIEFIDSTQDITHKTHKEKLYNHTTKPFKCGNGDKNGFVVGLQIWVNTGDSRIRKIKYLCSDETEWKGTNITRLYPVDHTIDLICQTGSAICSIQSILHSDHDRITDIRIGCCKAGKNTITRLPWNPIENPNFCHRTDQMADKCSQCEECQCCRIVDTKKVVDFEGIDFEFSPPVNRSTQHIILGAIAQQLHPSPTTELDWRAKIDEHHLGFKTVLALPNNLPGGEIWAYEIVEYTASCNGISVVYYTKTPVCKLRCTTVPPPVIPPPPPACKITDEWELVATHVSYGRSDDEEEEWGPPYITFTPDHIDNTTGKYYDLLHNFKAALSPSPTTGFDWTAFVDKVFNGEDIPDTYYVKYGEVPKNHFMNIYQLKGTCGGDLAIHLKHFKKVKFLFDAKNPDSKVAENCKTAKANRVECPKSDILG